MPAMNERNGSHLHIKVLLEVPLLSSCPAVLLETRAGATQTLSSGTEDDEDDAVKDSGDNDDQESAPDTATSPQQGSGKASSHVDLLDLDFGDTSSPAPAPATATATATATPSVSSSLDDILGLSMSSTSTPSPAPAPAPAPSMMMSSGPSQGMGTGLDLFAQPAPEPVVQKVMLLPAERGAGMEILGAFTKGPAGPAMALTCNNRGPVPLGGFVMQFNKNAYGLTPAESPQFGVVQPGMSAEATVRVLRQDGMVGQNGPANQIQIAVKNSTGNIFFFTADLPAGFI